MSARRNRRSRSKRRSHRRSGRKQMRRGRSRRQSSGKRMQYRGGDVRYGASIMKHLFKKRRPSEHTKDDSGTDLHTLDTVSWDAEGLRMLEKPPSTDVLAKYNDVYLYTYFQVPLPDTLSSSLREYVHANQNQWDTTLKQLWGTSETSLPTNTVVNYVRAMKKYNGEFRIVIIPSLPIERLPLLYNQKAYSYIRHRHKFTKHPYYELLKDTMLIQKNIDHIHESIRDIVRQEYVAQQIPSTDIPSGEYTYVYLRNGNVVLCPKFTTGTGDCKHASLVPPWEPVKFAGEVKVTNYYEVPEIERVYFDFDSNSGTYAPSPENTTYISTFFQAAEEYGFPYEVDDPDEYEA